MRPEALSRAARRVADLRDGLSWGDGDRPDVRAYREAYRAQSDRRTAEGRRTGEVPAWSPGTEAFAAVVEGILREELEP